MNNFLANPEPFVQNIISGFFVALIVELLITAGIVQFLIKRAENKKWEKTRREFQARVLDHCQNICYAFSKHLLVENSDTASSVGEGSDEFMCCRKNLVFVREEIDSALRHVENMSTRFDNLVAIYAIVLPSKWFSRVSTMADELRATAAYAGIAASNWTYLEASIPRKDDPRFKGIEKRAFIVENKTRQEDGRLVISDDVEEKRRQIFFKNLYLCCVKISELGAEMLMFAQENTTEGELQKTEVFHNLKTSEKIDSKIFI